MELWVACLGLLGCALLAGWPGGARARVGALAVGLLLCVPLLRHGRAQARLGRARAWIASLAPHETSRDRGSPFAGSQTCRSCHPSQHATWAASYHRRMTQAASDDAILAPWQGEIVYHGRRYQLRRRGERYLVEMPAYGTRGDRPEDRVTRPIVMTTGSHHQQLYWMPTGLEPPPALGADVYRSRCASCHGPRATGGKAAGLAGTGLFASDVVAALATPTHQRHMGEQPLRREEHEAVVAQVVAWQLHDGVIQFPFSWFVREQRWVHEDDTFVQPPFPISDVERYDEGWSGSCDQCHTLSPRYDVSADGSAPLQVAELGVVCESCHGPGARHAARHRTPLGRYREHLDDAPPGDIVLPSRLDHRRSAALCGQCHAEIIDTKGKPLSERFVPGDTLEQHVHVVQLETGPPTPWLAAALELEPDLLASGFWRDGTIRIAGRDYNGLAASACFTRGELTCISCHRMHGSDPNDQLGPQAEGNAVCVGCHEPIAADLEGHTHHAPDSAGSVCYNCHMPRTTFGLLSVMRAHRITNPDATVAATSGRPDACSLCHVDRSLRDTAATLTRWYGQSPLTSGQPVATSDAAAAVFWLLRGDAVQRAVAAWHLGSADAQRAAGRGWQAGLLAQLLDDPYAAVRYITVQALRGQAGFDDFDYDYTLAAESQKDRRRDALARAAAQPAPTLSAEQRRRLGYGDGALDQARIAAMQSQRDDTAVSVNE